jgi:ligand-binding sensor domain-containing protein
LVRQLSIQMIFLTLMFALTSCNAQVKSDLPKDTIGKSNSIIGGQQKIIKNHFFPQYPDEFFFIQCGLQDKVGNMWFGSAGDGIYYYDGKSFTNFTRKDGLCHNDILCCMEDKNGIIWFGTRNGLIRYTPTGKQPVKSNFKCITISSNAISNATQEQILDTYINADNFVWSILQDKSGKIWFATDKGVYIYNPLAGRNDDMLVFTLFLDTDNLINNSNLHLKDVSNMLEDRNGNIWFASGYIKGEGICHYDGKCLTNFKPDSVNSFYSIIERKNGNLLFLSGFHGVYSYDGSAFTKFNDNIGIKNDTLFSMLEDKAGNLWLSNNCENIKNSRDGGVLRYDGKSLQLFTTKEGLSHNCICCIVEDRDGDIWFGTRNTGLCRYDGKSFTDFTE